MSDRSTTASVAAAATAVKAVRRLLRSATQPALRRPPPGASPGTLVADPTAPPPTITGVRYRSDKVEEFPVCSPASLPEAEPGAVTWVDVDGLGDLDVVRKVAECYHLHRLALEDVVQATQRGGAEGYDEHLSVIVRMAIPAQAGGFVLEQLTLFLGDGYLLTFQEGVPGDPFAPVRDRIRRKIGRVRGARADYLAYALLDAVVDGYFPIIERIGEALEQLEDEVLANPTRRTLPRIHLLRRDLLALRRAAWPLRETLNAVLRDHAERFEPETRLYLRDCYGHTVEILDTVDTYRDVAGSLVELYMSVVNNRMNEVMKFLTVLSAIFLPMSFIASVYGMNFDPETSRFNMPELKWLYGYPFALLLMLLTAVVLLGTMWRRGWLRSMVPRPDLEPEAAEADGS